MRGISSNLETGEPSQHSLVDTGKQRKNLYGHVSEWKREDYQKML